MKLAAVFLCSSMALFAGSRIEVDLCLDARGLINPYTLARAKQVSSRIMREADVELVWQGRRNCPSDAIGIELVEAAPRGYQEDVLAYAKPFMGNVIQVFRNRISDLGDPKYFPIRLGFVLAHEITHALEVSDFHTHEGIMKAKWESKDLFEMLTGRLRFTQQDVERIQRGLAQRPRRIAMK